MPRETEAKFRVESHEPVRKRLLALGATLLGCGLETNRIYDSPDGSLRGRGYGLRIRSVVEESSDAAATPPSPPFKGGRGGVASLGLPPVNPATLTVKGPVVAGAFKSREELEVQINDAKTAAGMLEAIGFVPILCYQKRRESWRLGDCRIELDEPPHIGLFVEIEGPNEAAIRATQAELDLAGSVHVKASYVQMLIAYCDEHGVTNRVLDLPDANVPPM